MARHATAAQIVDASPAEVFALWEQTDAWPRFVEGCARVMELGESWPAVGSWVVWRSHPVGRGTVREEVVESGPAEFATNALDSSVVGTQRLTATPLPDGSGTELTLDLDYELVNATIFQTSMDWVFIRRALRDSLRRTLARFAQELAAPDEE